MLVLTSGHLAWRCICKNGVAHFNWSNVWQWSGWEIEIGVGLGREILMQLLNFKFFFNILIFTHTRKTAMLFSKVNGLYCG
jgi:hypothetical protein